MAHHIPAVISGLLSIGFAWLAGSDHSRIRRSSPMYLGFSAGMMLLALFSEAW